MIKYIYIKYTRLKDLISSHNIVWSRGNDMKINCNNAAINTIK